MRMGGIPILTWPWHLVAAILAGLEAATAIAVRPAVPVGGRFVRVRAPRAARWTFVSEGGVNPVAAEPTRGK